MRVKNETRWDTNELLCLLRECFKRIGEDIKEYTIEIVNARQHYVSGQGSYGRKWIKLRLPTRGEVKGSDGRWERPVLNELPGDYSVSIAQVVTHESDHTRGLHHEDMVPFTEIDAEWAREFIIHRKQPKPKPTREQITERRYRRVLELIAKNERRIKLAKARLRTLNKRKRYYERKFSKDQP